MEVVYRAHDGKELKTAEECLAHEEAEMIKANNLIKSLRALDIKGTSINPTENPEGIWYIYIPDKWSLAAFIKWLDDLGYITDGLDEEGKFGVIYAYDDRKDEWYCLNDKIRELNAIANSLTQNYTVTLPLLSD